MQHHLVRDGPKVYKKRMDRTIIKEKTYHQLFRFEKHNVAYLADTFLRPHRETRGGCLSSIQRMEITLRYLSDPGYQTSVAQMTGVTQSTVSKVIKDTLDCISSKHENWIKFPIGNNDVNEFKQRWAATLGFPFCLGAIDCTHIKIDKPSGAFGDNFINRKGVATFNVQATCDENYKFTSIDVGWPGSVHDSRIFKLSTLYAHLSRGDTPGVILGDSGYGIAPFLMKPFDNPENNIEANFNYCHSRNRVVIEQSFGQVKRRFPILRYGIRLNFNMIPKCIISCFVLHNVSKFLNDIEIFDEDMIEEDEPDFPEIGDPGADLRHQGEQRRREIADILFNRN